MFFGCFFNHTSTTEIYTLSLHDALPILHKHMQRLIAANVDVVVHVVSLKSPPLRPRLIDRFLIAIQRGGARPVICVNKVDRKSTRLNSSHSQISYAVFCLKKKKSNRSIQ